MSARVPAEHRSGSGDPARAGDVSRAHAFDERHPTLAGDVARGPAFDRRAQVLPRPGLASSLGVALAVALSDPGLWLLGAAGFLVRGGWLLLVLPIWSLPSPVAITTLLGADVLGTGRLTAQLVALILAGLAALAAALLASALLAAAVDVSAFERFVRHPDTLELRRGREARELSRGERGRLILRLVALSGLLLAPAGVALVATVLRMIHAGYQEYMLPGSLDVPLALRIASDSRIHLLVLALCLLGAEVLGSVASRRVMAGRPQLPRGAPGWRGGRPGRLRENLPRLLRGSLRAAATVLLTWLISLVLLVPVAAAIILGWSAVRSVLLRSGALETAAGAAEAGLVTILFVALWCAALLLVGLASAVRAALWSAESLG